MSWLGKYEAAWEVLVAGLTGGEVSADVVFLPDDTPRPDPRSREALVARGHGDGGGELGRIGGVLHCQL